jgi:AraC-like DNA-binding protein
MHVMIQIDLMARGASIALFLLWSWILFRDHRRVLAARIAIAMNIAIIAYVLATMAWDFRPSFARFLLSVVAGSTPGLFWLFARTWFNDKSSLERWPLLLVFLSLINIVVMHVSFERYPALSQISVAIFRLGMIAFAMVGLWEAWRGREGDLVEVRRRIRPRLVAAVGIYVIIIAFVEVAVFNYGAPIWVARSVGSSIAVITLMFCMAMFSMRPSDLFGSDNSRTKPAATVLTDDRLVAKLLHHMSAELPHRDETMSIAALAAQLGEAEYRLRRAINGQLGYRNFAAFLNRYRLNEVKSALADPGQKDVPIITIALDAGFGSLGPFNRAFRETEGVTPSEYRARHTG